MTVQARIAAVEAAITANPRRSLAWSDQVAIWLLFRKRAKATQIARAFGVNRVTVYYLASPTYSGGLPSPIYAQIKRYVDRIGETRAWNDHVSQEIIRKFVLAGQLDHDPGNAER